MELNDIKKALYKQKNQQATLQNISKAGILYATNLDMTDAGYFCEFERVSFLIPFSDIGDAKFKHSMEARHLIRWVVQNNQNQ